MLYPTPLFPGKNCGLVPRLRESDGTARPLPTYLYELEFDDAYPEDAEWFYSTMTLGTGGCSAVRRGNRLYRNYDWTFGYAPEFIIRMSGTADRFPSTGIASLGEVLTEKEVTSGRYSRYYRCLPGMTLDGINSNGVVAEINVDGGPKTGWHGEGANAIHILAAVRWVLDHGETAQQAAAYIAENIKQPEGDMNFHFMVADTTSTYIVENGEAHDVTNGTKVLTNYALYDEGHAGGGKERYDLLAGGADISAVNFTTAYSVGNDWDSDFDSPEQHAEAIRQWAAQGADKESHRGKTTASGKAWWQTVHTTEYDFTTKTMRVAVQESGEWFTFAAEPRCGYAERAGTADYADLASYAISANYASEASLASYADTTSEACYAHSAGHADHASEAKYASEASNACYASETEYASEASNACYANYANEAERASEASYASFADVTNNASYASEAEYASTAYNACYASETEYASEASNACYANEAEYASEASYASYAYGADFAYSAGEASYASYVHYASEAEYASKAEYASTAYNACYASEAEYASEASYASYACYANEAEYASEAFCACYAVEASCARLMYVFDASGNPEAIEPQWNEYVSAYVLRLV